MAWEVEGNLRGPQGLQGIQGIQGPKGDDGTGIAIAGSVATYDDLPDDLTAGDAGDGYLVEEDGLLYIWSGTAFPSDGNGVAFQGPQGPEGPEGPEGPQGIQGIQGEQGIQGVQGNQGVQGEKGDPGDPGEDGEDGAPGAAGADGADGADGLRGTQWFTGTGAPTTVVGSEVGDLYLDVTDGTVYVLE